jgi:hypothetical protein
VGFLATTLVAVIALLIALIAFASLNLLGMAQPEALGWR